MSHEYYLDLRGQRAPEPLLHTETYARQLCAGDSLLLELDDPDSLPGLEDWAGRHHCRLLIEPGQGDIRRVRLELDD
ncbi:sulfurtransferase TusA family protein [Alkalilimnicola sp. S0819]|uniref:sulfurtransferase TusA family protein n=1 Tax=Alkalilimnicola sp. S0819 TaxID=2613922 RepID=UPI00186A34A1|nr:sulfurtransferase TusA family protein [Alkalilimnicola sp. S0819]